MSTVGIEVVDDNYEEVTNEGNPDDPYDGDDTCEYHSIRGIRVVKGVGDVDVDFVPKKGETYFLVYVLYATGDSFTSHSGRIAFIDLFKSEVVAEQNKRIIEKHENDPSITLKAENGKSWAYNSPFHGYFETVEAVEIEKVQLL